MELKSKVPVITDASGGIGSAAVKLFVESGAGVLAVDRDAYVLGIHGYGMTLR